MSPWLKILRDAHGLDDGPLHWLCCTSGDGLWTNGLGRWPDELPLKRTEISPRRSGDSIESWRPGILSDRPGAVTVYGPSSLGGFSAYPPDLRALKEAGLGEWGHGRAADEVNAVSVDSLVRSGDIPPVDMLEIRLMGAELRALKGALWCLTRGILAVHLTVALNPAFEGQPLFTEVDTLLRKRGFELLRMTPHPTPSGKPWLANSLYLKASFEIGRRSKGAGAGLVKRALIAAQAGLKSEAARTLAALHNNKKVAKQLSAAADRALNALNTAHADGSSGPKPGAKTPTPLSPWVAFHNPGYLNHNRKRLEHLDRLRLPFKGKRVLEVGAGIGDLTAYLLQTGARVTASDGRPENVAILKTTVPVANPVLFDVEAAGAEPRLLYDVIFCYGLLYHLTQPLKALDALAARTVEFMVLESCILPGEGSRIIGVDEGRPTPHGSISGRGCLPTRRWLWDRLTERFAFVYSTLHQPDHPDFPQDYAVADPNQRQRVVFVAARRPLTSPGLVADYLSLHEAP